MLLLRKKNTGSITVLITTSETILLSHTTAKQPYHLLLGVTVIVILIYFKFEQIQIQVIKIKFHKLQTCFDFAVLFVSGQVYNKGANVACVSINIQFKF
jgi:hypothetical protein